MIVPPTADAEEDSVQEKKLLKAIKKKLGRGCFTKTVDYWTYEVN